jgi:hypothetical protein
MAEFIFSAIVLAVLLGPAASFNILGPIQGVPSMPNNFDGIAATEIVFEHEGASVSYIALYGGVEKDDTLKRPSLSNEVNPAVCSININANRMS